MNTIKDLAKNWWATLNWSLKDSLSNFYYNGAIQSTLLDEEIENIFYQEVIIKWYVGKYGKIEFDYNEKEIRNIYLKEHSKEEPKQEITLEEAAAKHFNEEIFVEGVTIKYALQEAFIEGAKWKEERSYSEEEVYSLLEQSMKDCHLWELEEHYSGDYKNLKEWFEQFKKK
jgi:hypothetical protein